MWHKNVLKQILAPGLFNFVGILESGEKVTVCELMQTLLESVGLLYLAYIYYHPQNSLPPKVMFENTSTYSDWDIDKRIGKTLSQELLINL